MTQIYRQKDAKLYYTSIDQMPTAHAVVLSWQQMKDLQIPHTYIFCLRSGQLSNIEELPAATIFIKQQIDEGRSVCVCRDEKDGLVDAIIIFLFVRLQNSIAEASEIFEKVMSRRPNISQFLNYLVEQEKGFQRQPASFIQTANFAYPSQIQNISIINSGQQFQYQSLIESQVIDAQLFQPGIFGPPSNRSELFSQPGSSIYQSAKGSGIVSQNSNNSTLWSSQQSDSKVKPN